MLKTFTIFEQKRNFVMYGMSSLLKLMLIQEEYDVIILCDYVVEETTGNNEINKDEMRRLFCSTLDQVINEINVRFSHHYTKIYAALSALQPENSNFLNVKMVQSLLDLVDGTSVEAEFDVAKTCAAKFNGDEKTKPTTTKILSDHCETPKAMPAVHLALKLEVALGASTTKCESSFSVLPTTMRDCRQSKSPFCPTFV